MKLSDKVGIFLTGAAAVPFVWMVLSWVNVLAHNTTDYCYAWWNMFELLF